MNSNYNSVEGLVPHTVERFYVFLDRLVEIMDDSGISLQVPNPAERLGSENYETELQGVQHITNTDFPTTVDELHEWSRSDLTAQTYSGKISEGALNAVKTLVDSHVSEAACVVLHAIAHHKPDNQTELATKVEAAIDTFLEETSHPTSIGKINPLLPPLSTPDGSNTSRRAFVSAMQLAALTTTGSDKSTLATVRVVETRLSQGTQFRN